MIQKIIDYLSMRIKGETKIENLYILQILAEYLLCARH